MREWCLPARGRACFDQLPATIEYLLAGSSSRTRLRSELLDERVDRVILVYLDAFGWRFLERQREHPLIKRVSSSGEVIALTSQFPSTTTAHVPTIHSGLPVAAHGLYEWHLFEPSLNRLITPLPFCFAGDTQAETLAGILDPRDVYSRGSFYRRLQDNEVGVFVALPSAFAHSSANEVLLEDAQVLPFTGPRDGLAAAATSLAAGEQGYAHIYLGHVDSLMHEEGPDTPAVDAAFAEALTLILDTNWPSGALLLLTADHGMAPVDPDRTVYVNEIWPELPSLLKIGADGKPLAPAGSCRDLFLHTNDDALETVRDGLAERLDGVADVLSTGELVRAGAFAEPSESLSARLADVAVLPHYGEAVYWHEPGRFSQKFRGQHGGLSAAEMEIPLLAWVA